MKLTFFPAICGSDLHMYQGRTAAEGGLIFGMPVAKPNSLKTPPPTLLYLQRNELTPTDIRP